ncbi:hypothetical protein H8S90_01335 [Olivibacter sp. SDN3]|uniref:hypothetical protein n=1 Tax=Olivibacter sp. SDN3 TaxID=2764720 RepID=UPI00165177E6|nr:hypothetical protein [Olivibacter sp. SDN3]QNL50302.1 hypothetical protein H8S90_01335 [Olivibacter sp. SDN3]
MKKKKVPKSIKAVLREVHGRLIPKLFPHQPTKFYPIVTLFDDEEIIVSTSDFNLTIQCAEKKGTEKNLYKNLIKSPV